MAITLLNGIRVPEGTDQAAPQADMDRLGRSARTVLTAASQAQATALVTQVSTQLGWTASTTLPILVLRTDINTLQSWDGSSWRT